MTPLTSRKVFGYIQTSPNSLDPSTQAAAFRARQATRINPRFMVASQKPFADDPTGGASVVQIPSVRKNATAKQLEAAVTKVRNVIDKRFARGAEHVVLDEIRTNTAPVAAELFRQLPPEYRGKLAAFVVGGAGVKYKGNTTLAPVWEGMSRNQIQAMPETYGGYALTPGESMNTAAADARAKLAFLRQHGIAGSLAVSPLDAYHNPRDPKHPKVILHDPKSTQIGNQHAVQWVNTLRRVMPNAPLSEWAVGGTKNTPLPGRRMLAAILR